MATWQDHFDAFSRLQREPGIELYKLRLAYESHVVPLLDAHDRISDEERAEIEAAFGGLWEEMKSPLRTHYHLLPAYAVLLLRNPQNWVPFGSTLAPSAELNRRLGAILDADPARETNPYWSILRGILDFINGREESACLTLAAAARLPEFSMVVPCSLRGAVLSKPLPDLATLKALDDRLSESPVRVDHREPLVSDHPYLSFSCDPVYFEAFAEPTLESLVASGATAMNLHFHVVQSQDNDPAVAGVSAALIARCAAAGYSLCLTSETKSGADRTYFAAARFLRAKDILTLFNHPIVVSDMDMAYTKDPTPYIDRYSRQRVSILVTKGPYWGFMPWRRYSAGHVAFPASPEGLEYADILRRTINYLWREESYLTWWVDQYALWLAARTMFAMDYGPFIDKQDEWVPFMSTSVAFKIAGLKRVQAIRQRMDQGEAWYEAISVIQQERAAPAAARGEAPAAS